MKIIIFGIVLLFATPALAVGLCENTRTTIQMTHIDPGTGDFIVRGDAQWCEEVNDQGKVSEQRGSIRFWQIRDKNDSIVRWFSAKQGRKLKHHLRTLSNGEKVYPWNELVLERRRRFVRPDKFRKSPSGRCKARVRSDKPSNDDYGWKQRDVHWHFRIGKKMVSLELGEAAQAAANVRVETLFLPATQQVLVWAAIPRCGGPPPGYFGNDGDSVCYSVYETMTKVLTVADTPAVASCFKSSR